jgi:hypothetical protein
MKNLRENNIITEIWTWYLLNTSTSRNNYTLQCCCFFGLDLSFNILKTKPVRFGSWLCSHLQVKIPILLGPIEEANPNPWFREWDRHFHLKTGVQPAAESQRLCFKDIERWIKSRET